MIRTAALAGTAISIALSAPALAQEGASSASDRYGISEIVVTAQKREQSIQDVPIAVTALGADAIEKNNITNVRDLDSIAPNLQVKTLAGGSGAPQFTMRGAVGIGTAPGADKGISVYLDGVYLGSSAGQIFDIADIERIEVLRGPQGTLFGRNSSAGAISIVTKGPQGELQFKQKFTRGNYDQFQSQTRIDTPRFGPFSATATYTHIERRGDIRNLGGGTIWDFSNVAGPDFDAVKSPRYLGGRNSESIMVAVKGEFSSGLDVTYKYDRSVAKFSTEGVGLLATNFVGGYGPFLGAALEAAFNAAPNVSEISATRPDAVNNWFTTNSRTVNSGHNVTANWQVTDNISVRNVFGYRKSYFRAPGSNFDGLGGIYATPGLLGVLYATVPEPARSALIAARTGAPFQVVAATAEGRDEQASDELQVNYVSDFMTLTVGGIYYWQKTERGGFGTALGALNFTPTPNYVIPNANALPSIIHIDSYAGFAQAELHLTPELDLVGGARLTHDKKKGVDRAVAANPVPFVYEDTRPSFLIGVNFEPTDDMLLYAKFSTGFISGGQLGFAYDAETSESWEAGLKADWLDHRIRTNLAVFFVKYGNLQSPNSGRTFAAVRPDLVSAGQVLANVGDAEAYGFELESTFKPIDPITLTANLGYTHFKYTSLREELEQVGSVGVHNRPKWTNTFSAQYETEPVLDGATLQFLISAKYRSDQLLTSTIVPYRPQYFVDAAHTGDVWLFDARATLADIQMGQRGSLKASIWGKNIFDSKKINYGADLVGAMTAKYENAATYGVDVTFEFR